MILFYFIIYLIYLAYFLFFVADSPCLYLLKLYEKDQPGQSSNGLWFID